MRAVLILLISMALLGLFLWIFLSGALLVFASFAFLLLVVISVGYTDTMLLFMLGAREVRSSDEKILFEAASQEAYKLGVSQPRVYFYNGLLERAFVFQSGQSISLVLNKSLIQKSTGDELRAICFELLLQTKKGMAKKRTRAMFYLGLIAWLVHALFGLILKLIPARDIKKSAEWFLNYLIYPVLDFLFRIIIGEKYFKKLEHYLTEYPLEKERLDNVGLKLRTPYTYNSLPSRKILEFFSVERSKTFQNILALEFLPHEWDYLFKSREINSAE